MHSGHLHKKGSQISNQISVFVIEIVKLSVNLLALCLIVKRPTRLLSYKISKSPHVIVEAAFDVEEPRLVGFLEIRCLLGLLNRNDFEGVQLLLRRQGLDFFHPRRVFCKMKGRYPRFEWVD